MIPILYERDETEFESNGLGRLRDVTSCIVTEERNGIYECDFEMPIDGAHFDDVQIGRIIAVEHDESGDVQPFDIVSYSRPISGFVTFHAVHISYRQSKMTASGTDINSLSDAFSMLRNAEPDNPFDYWTDKGSNGFMSAADGEPRSVRQLLGGIEGSILDTYGGEYEWDKFTVKLWAQRGEDLTLTIRYGVNMLDYTDETDASESYNAVIPFWKGTDESGNEVIVKGSMVNSEMSTQTGRVECIPLNLSDKFETQPTVEQVENMAMDHIAGGRTYLPATSIKVDFVRLTDSPEYAKFAKLQECKLCDTVRVIFPTYKQESRFKIVKTEYDVLQERFTSLELGTLSTSLAEALGISVGNSRSGDIKLQNIILAQKHTLTTTLTASNGNTVYGTYTVSKNGFYPVGVVGWEVANGAGSGGSGAVPTNLSITNQSEGSADIHVGIRAAGTSVSNCTFSVTVLWLAI
jgi:phage minor structural protein